MPFVNKKKWTLSRGFARARRVLKKEMQEEVKNVSYPRKEAIAEEEVDSLKLSLLITNKH